jgi:hypothetical protein
MISCRIADRARWLVSAPTLGVPLAGLVPLHAALPAMLTAKAADDEGFVVPPDGAIRIVGEGCTLLSTQRDVCRFSCWGRRGKKMQWQHSELLCGSFDSPHTCRRGDAP